MYISSAWLKATRGAHFLRARLISTSKNRRMTTEIISDIATRSVPSATTSVYSFQMQTTGMRIAPIRIARPVIAMGRAGAATAGLGLDGGSRTNAPRGCSDWSVELMGGQNEFSIRNAMGVESR